MFNLNRDIRFVSMFLIGTRHWDRNWATPPTFSVTLGYREPGLGSNCVHR
jgi:hypothetical protein